MAILSIYSVVSAKSSATLAPSAYVCLTRVRIGALFSCTKRQQLSHDRGEKAITIKDYLCTPCCSSFSATICRQCLRLYISPSLAVARKSLLRLEAQLNTRWQYRQRLVIDMLGATKDRETRPSGVLAPSDGRGAADSARPTFFLWLSHRRYDLPSLRRYPFQSLT